MTGDPWDGRTLEWSTSSPPPAYNFAFTPVVHDNDAWCGHEAARLRSGRSSGFKPIHMPKNTGAGFILAGFALRARLRADLAHLVAGGRRASSRCSPPRSSTPSTTTATSTSRRTRSTRTEDARTPTAGGRGLSMTHDYRSADRDRRRAASSTSTTSMPRRSSGTLLGFWIYLMSDCLIFACLFATYGVLGRNYAGGPSRRRAVRAAAGRAQHRAAAALLDHLRLRHAGDAAGTHARRR